LTGFVWVERARMRAGREAVASLTLFRRRSFTAGTVTAALMSCGDVGFQLVLPLFTGFVFGYDPLAVGFVLAAYGLGIGLGGVLAERACQRFDERTVALTAIGVLPVALVALIPMFTPGGSGVAMAGVLAVYGVAWGVAYATLVNIIFRDVPEPASAMAGGMQSSMRLLAGAVAAAVLTAVFAGVSVSRAGPAAMASEPALLEHMIKASPKVLNTYRRLGSGGQGQHETLPHGELTVAAVSDAYSAGAQATIAVTAGLTLLAFGAGLALPHGPPPRRRGRVLRGRVRQAAGGAQGR
jgi:MFS family permease